MFFFYTVFILSISTLSHCEKDGQHDKLRTAFVERIITKVSNMSLESISNASPEKKHDIIKEIEAKLRKSANSLGGNGRKYLKLIMRGVKMISSNDTKIKTPKTVEAKSNLRDKDENVSLDSQTKKPKTKLINDIANKIEKLAKVYFKNTKTPEERYEIMENIKNKIMRSVNVKHKNLHMKHDELKTYIDLITRGVELVLKKTLDDNSRRMDIEFSKNINVERDNDIPVHSMNNEIRVDSCNNTLNETCSIIKSLDKLECLYDNNQISVAKLCDGAADCSDESDEQYCEFKATEKVLAASKLISKLNSPILNKCFNSLIDSNLLRRQNEVLDSLLKSELSFLNKYSNITSKDKTVLMATVHDISDVLTTLAYALHKSLCTHLTPKDIENFEVEPLEMEDPIKAELIKFESEWSPKLCSCKGQFCQNTTCHSSCKRVCWQKYSLDRWSCQSVSGGNSVAIDLICDGKLDCLDETDETGCTQGARYTKFEANEIFNTVLKMIETKVSLNDNLLLRTDLLKLNKVVKQLQQTSIKKHINVKTVKAVRNKCFSIMSSIYNGTWQSASIIDEVEDIYGFLVALNKNLIAALKRTHVGNDKIIAGDGCFCRGNKCAMPLCSKSCIRRCAAEPLLTRYFCEGTSNNHSIALEAVCNDKVNCPNGDDERNCKMNEICRKHHFVILRHNLQDVGVKEKGTAIGEVLAIWKAKVAGSLSVAEKNERPSPKILRDIINDILQGLVKTYAAIKDYRRSDGNILKELTKLSKIIIDTIKECGK